MVSHNIHGLKHIFSDYLWYGQLDSCSCFVFENYMRTLKQMLRKHEKPLEQVIKRYKERIHNEIISPVKQQYNSIVLSNKHCNGPLIKNTCSPQYLKLILHNKINTNTNTSSNVYILTKLGEVVQIKNIAHCNFTKEVVVIGYVFKNKQLFYDKPVKSSKLNIFFIVQSLSKNLKYWKATDIENKMILFPFKDNAGYIAYPILHSGQ